MSGSVARHATKAKGAADKEVHMVDVWLALVD